VHAHTEYLKTFQSLSQGHLRSWISIERRRRNPVPEEKEEEGEEEEEEYWLCVKWGWGGEGERFRGCMQRWGWKRMYAHSHTLYSY
jgi:hypothetical protein